MSIMVLEPDNIDYIFRLLLILEEGDFLGAGGNITGTNDLTIDTQYI